MGSVRMLRFIDAVLRVIVNALLALFRVFSSFWHNSTKGVRLPPITEPLLRVSAVQLARNIRRKQVTSVSVVQAYIDRIQEVNPLINALVKDRFAAALQEAAQVDKLIEEESGGEDVLEDRLPLLGVPITVKEAIAMQGMPNSTGLLSRKAVVSGVDATVVALLKRAGAIPLGVTNCSELAMWVESHNYLYGITKNPYDLTRIAGGSSGGEGSIIGSGASVIGVGSDIGGSIRMPCFFNGIFGHKPTSGIVSNAGQFPPASGQQVDFLCTGPMCRYAEDLVPLLRIMAGSNVEKLSLSTNVDLRKLRFFSVPHAGRTLIYSPVDQQLIQIQKKVVKRLEADFGVQVQELYIPELKYSFQIWEAMMSAPGKDGKPPTTFAKLMGGGEKKVWPLWEFCKWFLGLSSHTMPAIGLALAEMFQSSVPSQFILEKKESLQKELEEMLGTDGVMLYPPHPHLAPRHHEPLLTPFNFSYTGIFNILGLPVTQCPLGLSDEGLPLGVQLVAGKLQDHLTLATAQYLEQTFGGWREPGATEHTPPNSTSNNGNEPN